nr:trimethylguanosine synthase isoform X1 [Ipomoea batatas]
MGSPAVEEETPAIKALGSPFKLTEIYLSDDTSYEVHRCLDSTEASRAIHEDAVDSNINSEFDFLPEDMELAKLMSGMGLPMSFHTTQRNGTPGGKRKQKKKHTVPTQDGVQEPIEERVGGYASSTILHKTSESLSCLLIGRESELSTFDNAASFDEVCHIPARVKDSISSTSSSAKSTIYEFIPSDLGQDQELNSKSTCHDILLREDIGVMEHLSLDGIVGAACDSKDLTGDHMESICVESTLAVNHDGRSGFGDWKVYWDNFYSRNYFYNLISQECTWDPPPGMEELVFINIKDKATEPENDTANLDVTLAGFEESADQFISCGAQPTLDLSEEHKGDIGLLDQQLHDSIGDELECTWDPPPEIEELVFINITDKATEPENDIANLDVTLYGFEESADQLLSCGTQPILDLSEEHQGDIRLLDQQLHDSVGDELVADISCHTSSAKRKKKSRRVKSKQNLSIRSGEFQFPSIIEGFYPGLSKYWCQRYRLFSKYDEGIQMDEEGWFSVTPESLAKHHADRCANGTIVDFFTGVGGNAIQFAQRCRHVIAIDIDPKKIDYAQHNAAIYGVSDQIDFIRGDSFTLAPMLKVDVVFMSPPWGGPDYAKVKTFDIKTMLKPHDGHFLFNIATRIAPKVVMFLPKTVDINQLAELALSANPPWSLEVEKNFLNGKLKAITAYFIKSSS